MFKKVMIAALAVVVGGGFLMFGSRAVSHVRLMCKQMRAYTVRQVPPEQELKRLRMELNDSKKEDNRIVDSIVKLEMEVERVQGSVTAKKERLAKLDREMKGWETALAGEGTDLRVSFNGTTRPYSRTSVEAQLRADARAFLNVKNTLKGEEELLKIKQETLTQTRQRLSERQAHREKKLAELQQLENSLLELRRAQATGAATGEDDRLSRFNQDFQSLQERIKAEQRKNAISAGTDQGPIRNAESLEKSKGDTEVENLLKSRRAPGAPVAGR
jgi:hypothetical protein